MRDASPFPGQPPQRPWDQVCWPHATERDRGTEDMRGQLLMGLDGVACFMPKSDQKAPGFVHDIDKGQRGRHATSQQRRKGELLAGFRPSSKPASKRQGQQEGTVLAPGHSEDITHFSEQTPYARALSRTISGGSTDPSESTIHSGSHMPQVLPPVLPLAPSQFPSL